MEDVKIILSGLWVATMLTFLWGDVLSIIAGDAEKMFTDQTQMTQAMWIGIAVLMMILVLVVSATPALAKTDMGVGGGEFRPDYMTAKYPAGMLDAELP